MYMSSEKKNMAPELLQRDCYALLYFVGDIEVTNPPRPVIDPFSAYTYQSGLYSLTNCDTFSLYCSSIPLSAKFSPLYKKKMAFCRIVGE